MSQKLGKVLSFSVTNFAPFKNKTTIDFEQHKPVKNNKVNIRYIKTDSGRKILPVIGIYGKNACGKTSIMKAFWHHCISIRGGAKLLKFDPFLFTEDKKEFTESELIFTYKKSEYKHTIRYDNEKVILEEFAKDDVIVFKVDRKSEKYTAKDMFPNKSQAITSSHEAFFKQHYNQNTKQVLLYLFVGAFANEYGLEILPESFCMFEGYGQAPIIPDLNQITQDDLQKINLVMSNIQNHFKSISKNENGAYVKYEINNKIYDLTLSKENKGTHRIAHVYAKSFVEVLRNGWILCIDEIDSNIHPEALHFLVSAFKNPNVNKNGATLIFTAHNTKIIDFINHEDVFLCDRSYTDYTANISCPALSDDYNKKTFKTDFENGYYGSLPTTSLNLFGIELFSDL